jgi:membrane protein implicated in regulation of membrane protease activity
LALLATAVVVDLALDASNAGDPNSLKSPFTLIVSGPLGWLVADDLADLLTPGWVTLPITMSFLAGLLQVALVLALAGVLRFLSRPSRQRVDHRSKTSQDRRSGA